MTTCKGLQPGNSDADVLDGFLLAQYLKRISGMMTGADVQTTLATIDVVSGLYLKTAVPPTIIRAQTYADDSAVYISADDFSALT